MDPWQAWQTFLRTALAATFWGDRTSFLYIDSEAIRSARARDACNLFVSVFEDDGENESLVAEELGEAEDEEGDNESDTLTTRWSHSSYFN